MMSSRRGRWKTAAVACLLVAAPLGAPASTGAADLVPDTHHVKIEPGSAGTVSSSEQLSESAYEQLLEACRSLDRSDGVEDELSGCQWHLDNRAQRGGTRGEDANVAAAHAAGYLGEGVGVAVVDGGIYLDHEDLAANTDSSRTHTYCESDTAPFINGDDHGTAVAGVIAARDNDIGMRGVAPRAELHNRRLLCDTRVRNIDYADAMTREMASICVSNNSWGWEDGVDASPVSFAFDLAVDQGLSRGCGGKGIVYVWSGGNGALVNDDANLSELVNYYGVTAVCAVNASGVKSVYSESGANLWVCGPSNDGWWTGQPGVATLTNDDRYRFNFGGTSSAAPTVAGAAALVRAANRELTWRDVKLILAASARQNHAGDGSWREGAVKYGETEERYQHSRDYGFGVVDAHAAVELAETWTNVPAMVTETRVSVEEAFQIPGPGESISRSVKFGAAIEFVEFVQVNTVFRTSHFRDLRIDLISPSGTEVMVVPAAPSESDSETPLNDFFRFGVAGLLGEPAEGTWTLKVTNMGSTRPGSLDNWSIKLFGHSTKKVTPTLTSVVANGYTLTATWTPPEHTGASEFIGYDLRYAGPDRNWITMGVPGGADALSHTFEVPAPGRYDVRVRAKEAGFAVDGEWSPVASATVSNTDPVFAADAMSIEVAENSAAETAVGEPVAATDVDKGAVLAYSLGGADAASFAIDGATGQISVSSVLDFEAPADSDSDGTYELSVSVSDGLDGGGGPDRSVDDSVAVSVEVTDVDEPPALVASDCDLEVADWASGDWECVFEATDTEGAAVVWSLSGDDAALFVIDGGVVSLAAAVDAGAPGDADTDGVYEVTVTATVGDHVVSADVSLSVLDANAPPVFEGRAPGRNTAPPGVLVSLVASQDDFVDPEGDEMTFTLTASRDDVHLPGLLTYSERYGRIFFAPKNACALDALDPPLPLVFDTVVTMTATDPEGASGSTTATFRTDRTDYVCASLASAAVDGAAVTLEFDAALTSSLVLEADLSLGLHTMPAADEFAVTADGATVALADAEAVSVEGTTVTLALASPVAAGQAVAVSYTPGVRPVAAAFADETATNNTPEPEPEETDCSAEPDEADPTVPVCAAVSGKELTLTFNRDLAAISKAAADSLRFSFFIEGAYYQGTPVAQSPNRVAVDGATLTLTLGIAIRAGDEVTVSYFGNTFHDNDGTPVADFTTTLTTTERS